MKTGRLEMKRVVAFAAVAVAALLQTEAARIGIVTDTHVGAHGQVSLDRLERCYRLFKEKQVDYIFNLGDIADAHSNVWYRQYAEVRAKVFPDGAPPEKFVFATHDRMKFDGAPGGREYVAAFEAMKPVLGVTHDRYHRFEIEGFTFLVYPQARDNGRVKREVDAECAAHPGRPLFVLDHVPPPGTVEGSDYAARHNLLKLYAPHPEVVLLTGHVHGSLAHEGKIWQGAFTALNFGTLKNNPVLDGDYYAAVMDLDKERAVIRRYAIATGAEVRPEQPWTLKFPYDPKTPAYSPAARAAQTPKPAFAPGAELTVRGVGEPLTAVEVAFPAAPSADIAEYRVEIAAKGKKGKWVVRSREKVVADYARPPEKRRATFRERFSSGYFNAHETVRVTVSPVDFFGRVGTPLAAELKVGETDKWKTAYSGVPKPAKPGAYTPFKGARVWYTLKDSGFDQLPEGTKCRMVVEVSFALPKDRLASFNLQTEKSGVYCYGYIYTPAGKSRLRYVREFTRPAERGEPFKLVLLRAGSGKVRFDDVRIEYQ